MVEVIFKTLATMLFIIVLGVGLVSIPSGTNDNAVKMMELQQCKILILGECWDR